MSSNNNSPLSPVLTTELSLEKLREWIAGALALTIIVGMVLLCIIAVQNLGNAEQFQRAKDLLLILTPFVGVVIGYYFNKVTSDARAASLQRAVDAASQTAINATVESERAQTLAAQAQTQADQMRGALTEMVSAAENAGVGQPGKLGTLDAKENEDVRVDFLLAIERAKRALNS